MTPNYLKKMLPLLLDADPAQATNVRLVSLARAFVAGYELVSSVAPAGEFGTEETFRNRIDSLFWVLSERSEHEPDTAIRSRMVHAMYSLACKTVFPADLRKKNITGKDLQTKLDEVHITVNKNAIPNDPQKPGVTSGVRIGTPACTTRGFTPEDMPVVADCIDKIATDFESNRKAVLAAVAELVRKHPIYE